MLSFVSVKPIYTSISVAAIWILPIFKYVIILVATGMTHTRHCRIPVAARLCAKRCSQECRCWGA